MEALLAGEFTESAVSAQTPFAQQFVTLSRQEHIQLLREGRYWKRLHEGAVERLARLESEYRERLRGAIDSAARREEALQRDLEYAHGRIRDLEKRLFGRKSEQQWAIDNQQPRSATGLRKRGQRSGARGHGRRRLSELPVCEEIVALTSPCCPKCGKRLREFPGTEDSEVLEIEVKAYRRRIHRRRYRPSCRCAVLPGIVAAPAPGRLIERGKWGVSLWVQALLEKFLYGHSSGRWIEQLGDLGVELSAGTLCGGLRAIAPLFVPLYQALLPRLRTEGHWHADETRWEVFVEREGKAGHRWWLWVFQSRSVVYYVIDPSRSASVPEAVLAGVDSGVISCDRHGAYKKFSRLHPGIVLSFCWSHQRRDFLTLANDYPPLAEWAMGWVDRVGELFKLYDERAEAVPRSPAYRQLHGKLRSGLRTMARERHRALADPQLPGSQRKLLTSMQRHWQGLREFIRHSDVPPDNNSAERALRGPVVGRKNFYGSGSEWSGQLAAMMFSLLATLKGWQINPRTWLTDYLNACAAAGNRPPGGSEAVSALEHGRSALGADAPGTVPEHPGPHPGGQLVRVYCGRHFSAEDVAAIRELIESNPTLKRTPLSRRICEMFGWRQPNGALKAMSARVALLRMQADGLICLPPSQNPKNGRRPPVLLTAASDPQPLLSAPVHELPSLTVHPVNTPAAARLWNEYIARYHYLGYTPLSGSQMRYEIFSGELRVALISFGAGAWKLAARERFIGWDEAQRRRNLQFVINNARFLVLPWIQSKGLASKILSLVARQLPHHWQQRYGYRPVLLETFVETPRHRGTCYKAANWIHVGQTTGRGKLDVTHQHALPLKDIWLYPLSRNFRDVLRD